MQPTIICTAPQPGMLCVNGRFAGEIAPERPVCAPVPPFGAVYLEYRPLCGGAPPLARKCVFSAGMPLPESVADAQGLFCVVWPGGAVEIEMAPAPTPETCPPLEGRPCQIARGDGTLLLLGGAALPLPEGALPPRLERRAETPLLAGKTEDGGQYVASLSPDLARETGLLAADRIDFTGDDMLNAVVALRDLVGHGRLEQWIIDGGALRRVTSESVWPDGAPHWPDTAEGTAIAAVEAALAGLPAEAEGYLAPALAAEAPLRAIAEACDLCVPMKYGIPGGRPCVGLLRIENDHLARVRPLYYRAAPSGGRQGPWRIEAFSMEGLLNYH